MTARGIKVNHNGDTIAYAAWVSSNFLDPQTQDFSASIWVRVKGASSGSDGEGHTVFNMPADIDFYGNGGLQLFSNDATAASPWSFRGRLYAAALDDQNLTTVAATNEDWFLAFTWDATADQATWYYAKDGDSSLTSIQSAAAFAWGGRLLDGVYLGGTILAGNHKGSNVELTNCKFWVGGALSNAEHFTEMNSEAVMRTTNLFAHWKLASAADLNDYSGNGRDLTITGSVTSGTMDPVDLQGGSGNSGVRFNGGLTIRHI